jgi:SAM-dependent methyltransferase
MSFSAEWLALREPADAAARADAVTRRAVAWGQAHGAGTGRPLRILDLGAGTGANLRYLAPRLGVRQRWRLVDHDPRLLALARPPSAGTAATPWAPDVEIDSLVVDLAAEPLAELLRDADLITASALFDLVSTDWASSLLEAATDRGRALLAVLSYDGRIDGSPADPYDPAVRRAVNRHQRIDKGFGPALGPAAADRLAEFLRARGAEVVDAASDWRLDSGQAALQRALIEGWAAAARGIAPDEAPEIDAWRARRSAAVAEPSATLTVGHRDVFAAW